MVTTLITILMYASYLTDLCAIVALALAFGTLSKTWTPEWWFDTPLPLIVGYSITTLAGLWFAYMLGSQNGIKWGVFYVLAIVTFGFSMFIWARADVDFELLYYLGIIYIGSIIVYPIIPQWILDVSSTSSTEHFLSRSFISFIIVPSAAIAFIEVMDLHWLTSLLEIYCSVFLLRLVHMLSMLFGGT